MNKKQKILKQYFGFDSFRPIQESAINHILEKKDLLTILPTGSGKSLIFQLPTLMMDGTTIVISPLIALMQDQVVNLQANGISANMISSQNTNEQNDEIFNQLQNNQLKFLYIAPERFASGYFIEQLKSIDINFFVIDEAHCVSEWGHEFRDDYQKLGLLKDNFPYTPITAFTATATKAVEADILKTLSIDPSNVLRAKIQRTNLIIRSEKRLGNGKEQISEFLKTHENECGIIYCFTRKETTSLSEYLNSVGFDTLAYHAGLPSNTRDDIFKKFKNESVKIIVATIAFGMGIDKGNIRFVLHTSMPKTIENYSQEIGRAGRDGLNADVLMLYSKADEVAKRRFIDPLPQSAYKTSNYKKLETMYRFAISSKCRHQAIAKYFDDDIEVCETICDNCLGGTKEFQDITVESQKFISAILRCEERFGQAYIIDVLRGSNAKRILDFEHDKLSVHGIGKDYTKEQWGSIADTLLDMEAIIIEGEYRTLKITQMGREVLKKQRVVQIDTSHLIIEKTYKEYKNESTNNELFEKFRELRTSIAQKEEVAPYIIFGDKTLLEFSDKLPITTEEFLSVTGVGQLKLEKYGLQFLNLCKELRDSDIDKKPKKELSKTYIQTLDLIKENKTIDEICELRELKDSTIASHINALCENEYIDKDTKDKLFKPLVDNFPDDIKVWIEDGLKLNDMATLRQNINKYSYLFTTS
ncbi:MAG: DNA helicase RecQ [Campylobacterota bacterium]|nr:DNA helicase RecQ [Campylobacterota bacterium]